MKSHSSYMNRSEIRDDVTLLMLIVVGMGGLNGREARTVYL